MAAAPRLRPLRIHKGAGMRRARRIRRPEGEEDGEAGRVVLRRIEDRVHRGICFRKRLAVLCDTHVGFVVLSCSDGRIHPLRRARQGKDFHIPKETTDKGPNNDDMRSIDETDMSTLNMDQLSQVERLLEDEVRWTRARKVVVDRIARLQKKVRGKAAILEVERGSMEIPIVSGQEKEQVGGEVASLRIGAAAEQRHRTTPLDLNMPGWDAGPLQ